MFLPCTLYFITSFVWNLIPHTSTLLQAVHCFHPTREKPAQQLSIFLMTMIHNIFYLDYAQNWKFLLNLWFSRFFFTDGLPKYFFLFMLNIIIFNIISTGKWMIIQIISTSTLAVNRQKQKKKWQILYICSLR